MKEISGQLFKRGDRLSNGDILAAHADVDLEFVLKHGWVYLGDSYQLDHIVGQPVHVTNAGDVVVKLFDVPLAKLVGDNPKFVPGGSIIARSMDGQVSSMYVKSIQLYPQREPLLKGLPP